MSARTANDGFDSGAAVTRSLLGWGVVAGPFYVVVGLVLALTRPGFDLTRHQLSLLMLGDFGWAQTANLILVGLMVVAAAVGFHRALHDSSRATRVSILLGVFGMGMVGSGIFPPDPMAGFPAGMAEQVTSSGILHLAFGAIGFLALGAAAIATAGWFAERGDTDSARLSRVCGAIVIVGFLAGGALATSVVGVAALWLAVLVGLGWLAVASVRAYRTVPHPDADRRLPA